jgi:uncharacterized MAPEG superfamily protein
MNRDQKTVAAGAVSGVLAMLAALFVLSSLRIALPPFADAGERLAFAVKWAALAAAPLFFAIIAIGNARALSDAIDPTAGKESPAMVVDGRVVDNTLQQYVLFVAAALSVAAVSRGDQLGIVSGAAIIFVVSRFAFWIGYRIHPLYRAFGFASTAYLNIILFGVAVWRAWA